MNKYILFLVGCIGTRLILTILSKYVNKTILTYMGYLYILPAIGIIYLYLTDSRKTAREAQGKVWWNQLRPIHGVLYILFSIYAIKKQKQNAWKVLALDTFLGLLFWYIRYYV